MPPGSSLHPAICPLCPLNVDLQRTIELATRAFFHAVYRPRKSLSQQNYHKDESQGTLGQIGFIFAGTLGAKTEALTGAARSHLGSSFGIVDCPAAASTSAEASSTSQLCSTAITGRASGQRLQKSRESILVFRRKTRDPGAAAPKRIASSSAIHPDPAAAACEPPKPLA